MAKPSPAPLHTTKAALQCVGLYDFLMRESCHFERASNDEFSVEFLNVRFDYIQFPLHHQRAK